MSFQTGGWIKTAAGFLFFGVVLANEMRGEELLRLDLSSRNQSFALGEHEELKVAATDRELLLTPEVICCEVVSIKTNDGRTVELVVSRERTNPNFPWWLGLARQRTYTERIVHSLSLQQARKNYQAGLPIVDARKAF